MECSGCDLAAVWLDPPSGILHQTTSWVVNHVVGSMNLGTLIVGPREHIVALADLEDTTVAELGPVPRDNARVVEAPSQPEQTYACSWSHGAGMRRHLHIAV